MIINFNRNTKLNICIILFAVISLLIASYIFSNSAEKPVESNEKSTVVAEKVQTIVDPDETIKKHDFHKYVRKVAHIIEFTALGVSVGIMFMFIYLRTRRLYISMPLLLCLGVGIVDEHIQSFTERSSEIRDVLFDISGAVTGLVLVVVIALAVGAFRKAGEKRKVLF